MNYMMMVMYFVMVNVVKSWLVQYIIAHIAPTMLMIGHFVGDVQKDPNTFVLMVNWLNFDNIYIV